LTAIAPESARTAYNEEEFLDRNDNELVAALGNFINRNVTFAHKYFEGKVPDVGDRGDLEEGLLAECAATRDRVGSLIEGFHFKAALGEVMKLARAGNVYLDQRKPWSQRKSDMAVCGTTINVALQVVRTLASLMAPFLPFAAKKTATMLSLAESDLTWSQATTELAAGDPLGPAEILFKKLRV
jgi:methionyl-tRNA synthetase